MEKKPFDSKRFFGATLVISAGLSAAEYMSEASPVLAASVGLLGVVTGVGLIASQMADRMAAPKPVEQEAEPSARRPRLR